MKRQNAEGRMQKAGIILLLSFLLLTSHYSLPTAAAAAQWSGVDESVVQKYAVQHGRAPGKPVIDTDQGDMLLFLFLLGGAVAGFAVGYYWRQLTERSQSKRTEHRSQTEEIQ